MSTIVFPTVLHTFECLFCRTCHLDTVSLNGLKKPPKLIIVLLVPSYLRHSRRWIVVPINVLNVH